MPRSSRHEIPAMLAPARSNQRSPRFMPDACWYALRFYGRCIAHAWSGSWSAANAWAAVLGAVVLWVGASALGYQVVIPEDFLSSIVLVLACLAAAWAVIFVVRLLGAPASLFGKSQQDLRSLNEEVQRLRTPAPNLTLTIEGVCCGGHMEPIPNDPSAERTGEPILSPNWTSAMAWVTITNSGNMASVARNWRCVADFEGKTHESKLLALAPTQTITLHIDALPGVRPERQITITGRDSIFFKAAHPIPPGGMVQGILRAIFEGPDPDRFRFGPKFTFSCQDVLGRESIAAGSAERPSDIGYYPLIDQEIK